jgi:site-specific DNA-methyltransferase (cytosine-N4-specific)
MFFIKFLTDPGDKVLDIFAGSNTTGFAAEELERKWIAFEQESAYVAASAFRFLGKFQNPKDALTLYESLLAQQEVIHLSSLKY